MPFTEDDIQTALDDLTSRFAGEPGFVSVSFDGARLVVRFAPSEMTADRSLRALEVFDSTENAPHSVEVAYEEGPRIVSTLGEVGRHEPFPEKGPVETASPIAGGDACQSSRDLGHYGTIGAIFRRLGISASGRCSYNCTSSPALFSNNHVIAVSDRGQPGDGILHGNTGNGPRIASLNCFVPLSCNSDTDIATANLTQTGGVVFGEVRGVGRISTIRRPGIGEGIRKYGARTGYRNGRVTGQTNIWADGYLYRRVFSTTGGFGCAGDSGSAVVDGGSACLGVYSWGDDIPCENNPAGYFFSFVNPGRGAPGSDRSLAGFEADLGTGAVAGTKD